MTNNLKPSAAEILRPEFFEALNAGLDVDFTMMPGETSNVSLVVIMHGDEALVIGDEVADDGSGDVDGWSWNLYGRTDDEKAAAFTIAGQAYEDLGQECGTESTEEARQRIRLALGLAD